MSNQPTYTASIEWGGDGITYNPTPPDPAKKLRDDLLRALGREASNSARGNTGAWRDEAEDNLHIGLDLAHSPAGRDIVKHAVDAAEATHCLLMNHEVRLADAERRNTLLHDWAASLGCPPGVFTFEWLQQEIAERQARAVDLAQQLDRTQEECARRGDALRRTERERDTALASLTESNRVAAGAVQQLDEARKIRDEVQEVTLTAQRERDEALRAAPQLPDVGPVYAPKSVYLACEGQWFLSRHAAAQCVAQALAVVREFDRLATEVADTGGNDNGSDAVIDEIERLIPDGWPSELPIFPSAVRNAPVTHTSQSEGEAVAVSKTTKWLCIGHPAWPDPLHVNTEDRARAWFKKYRISGHPIRVERIDTTRFTFLNAESAALDTTPDTSRVSFGARHEVTGMVLLQHADLRGTTWGEDENETVSWHRRCSNGTFYEVLERNRPAHAALAEVRAALNTAEGVGVKVHEVGVTECAWSVGEADNPDRDARIRACRYLAREVQALVDQGLRGDDLNAHLPYEVRDHRVQEADTSNDRLDEVIANGVSELREHDWPSEELIEKVLRGAVEYAVGRFQSDVHRARREGGA